MTSKPPFMNSSYHLTTHEIVERTKNNMPKVLMISYVFPPIRGMGSIRLGKYYEYLPKFGYQPIVLAGGSSKLPEADIFRPALSAPIYKEKLWALSSATDKASKKIVSIVEKLQSLGLMSSIRMPDVFLIWALNALPLGLKILKKYQPDIIFSSHTPPSSHIVAALLAKKARKPWVAEFRDPWANNPYAPNIFLMNKLDAFLERQILRPAQAIITISPALAEQLSNFHGKPVEIIYNGFDEHDYPEAVVREDFFTISHTGIILPGKRDPSPVFQAVQRLASQNLITPEKFQIRFYGPKMDVLAGALAEHYGVMEYCQLKNPVSYKESLYRQCQSDLLLLLDWNSPEHTTIPGKFFEYLGANRPILCTGYRFGPVAEILQKTEMGVVLNDSEQIAEYILRQFEAWKKAPREVSQTQLPEAVKQFTRVNTTKKLAGIFDRLLLK